LVRVGTPIERVERGLILRGNDIEQNLSSEGFGGMRPQRKNAGNRGNDGDYPYESFQDCTCL
jgi:hypothetical protein